MCKAYQTFFRLRTDVLNLKSFPIFLATLWVVTSLNLWLCVDWWVAGICVYSTRLAIVARCQNPWQTKLPCIYQLCHCCFVRRSVQNAWISRPGARAGLARPREHDNRHRSSTPIRNPLHPRIFFFISHTRKKWTWPQNTGFITNSITVTYNINVVYYSVHCEVHCQYY